MSHKITVLSWNVHLDTFARDNRYVVQTLEATHLPEVICLQEYVQGADKTTLDWLTLHGYKTIYLPFASFPHKPTIGQGVMVAYKKGLNATAHTITLREDKPRRFRPFPNIRGAIDLVIKLDDGKVLSIINTHSTFARPFTIDMRKREFVKLTDYLNTLGDRSIFLCGDFNFVGFDRRRSYLKKKFDSFTGGILSKTWRHNLRFSPIRSNLDYMFWSKRSLLVSPKILPFNVSDHRPLVAEIG